MQTKSIEERACDMLLEELKDKIYTVKLCGVRSLTVRTNVTKRTVPRQTFRPDAPEVAWAFENDKVHVSEQCCDAIRPFVIVFKPADHMHPEDVHALFMRRCDELRRGDLAPSAPAPAAVEEPVENEAPEKKPRARRGSRTSTK